MNLSWVSGLVLSSLFAGALLGRLLSRKKSFSAVLFTNDQSGCCLNEGENCSNRYCMGRVYDAFEHHIDSARRLICIAIYMFTNQRICDAIIRAHKRGVIVRVIIDFKSFYAHQTKAMDLQKAGKWSLFIAHCLLWLKYSYRKIIFLGIPVRVYREHDSTLMHHKFCLIDVTTYESFHMLNKHPEGGLLINGSLNWTKSVSAMCWPTNQNSTAFFRAPYHFKNKLLMCAVFFFLF